MPVKIANEILITKTYLLVWTTEQNNFLILRLGDSAKTPTKKSFKNYLVITSKQFHSGMNFENLRPLKRAEIRRYNVPHKLCAAWHAWHLDDTKTNLRVQIVFLVF